MPTRLALLIAIGLFLAGWAGASPAHAAGLSDPAWKKARKQAGRLMKEPGRRIEKQKVIATLGQDDSRRAAEVLVKWTLRSLKLQQGPLSKALAEEKKDFEKVDRLMRRAYVPWPPKVWRDKGHKAAFDGAKKKWFMELAAEGPTLLFGALSKALEYADTFGEDEKRRGTGADTIFLLSDGSPTTAEGKALPTEEFERQYAAFLEANKIYRCVVHAIGIGPGHNVRLMQRIARDTGGQYKAVGSR